MTKNAKDTKQKKQGSIEVKPKTGRPTVYTDELGKQICHIIATTNKGLKKICEENKGVFPPYGTVVDWLLEERQPFTELYTRAKQQQADYLAEELQEIADDCEKSKFAVDKARLQVDVRKWTASKLKPKKYSERIVSEVTGKDGGAVKIEKTEYDLSGLTEEELLLFKTLSAKVVTKSNT